MRRLTILVVLGLAFAVGAEAGPKTSKPANAPKPAMTKTQAPRGGAPKVTTVKAPAPKGPVMKAAAGRPKASPVKAKSTQTTVSSGKSAKPTTSSPTRTTPLDFAGTSVGQKLQNNGAIRSKIEAKLRAAGYTGSVYEAAYGFKNLGQLNAATNQVQNQGYSFNLLKVLMTGTYVDPQTHVVYRTNRLPDGTVRLVRTDLATTPASTQSLGQAKQAIAAGIEMPTVESVHMTGTSTTTGSSSGGTRPRSSTATASKGTVQAKLK
jgi:hypothetical protein